MIGPVIPDGGERAAALAGLVVGCVLAVVGAGALLAAVIVAAVAA